MNTLTTKYFEVLERKLSLEDFRNWLQSLDNTEELKRDTVWKTFFAFNYAAAGGTIGYEFSKLLRNFNLDDYAIYKFGNTLSQILEDGNLFRIVRSCRDFDMRYNYPLFGLIGDFDKELNKDASSYNMVRQRLAAIAEPLELQWNSLETKSDKLALLQNEIEAAEAGDNTGSVYERFSGRLWKFWNN